MPKQKNETELDYMNRIRAVSGLPPMDPNDLDGQLKRESMMTRVAAARCYIGTCTNEEQARRMELAAFMEIFHPEVPPMTPVELKSALGQS